MGATVERGEENDSSKFGFARNRQPEAATCGGLKTHPHGFDFLPPPAPVLTKSQSNTRELIVTVQHCGRTTALQLEYNSVCNWYLSENLRIVCNSCRPKPPHAEACSKTSMPRRLRTDTISYKIEFLQTQVDSSTERHRLTLQARYSASPRFPHSCHTTPARIRATVTAASNAGRRREM